MNKKEQQEFNDRIVLLIEDIIWNMCKLNDGRKIQPSTQENLWEQATRIKGLLQP